MDESYSHHAESEKLDKKDIHYVFLLYKLLNRKKLINVIEIRPWLAGVVVITQGLRPPRWILAPHGMSPE